MSDLPTEKRQLGETNLSDNSGINTNTNTSCGQCSHPGCPPQHPDDTTTPCSQKCICYLTRTLVAIKNKIEEQTRILNEYASHDQETRCNVKLTASEEKLFGSGVVKDDSMVCCVLVRELRTQRRDLEGMMASWVEFADKADRFALVINKIRDKLAELTPRIDSLRQETKDLEEIELVNEETRGMEIDKILRGSEERREIYRETRYAEAEARDNLESLARQEKLDELERERLMDRAALKLALERMMKIMSTAESPDSEKPKEKFQETMHSVTKNAEKSSSPIRTTTANNPEIRIAMPYRLEYHDNRTVRQHVTRPNKICPGHFRERTVARRPF